MKLIFILLAATLLSCQNRKQQPNNTLYTDTTTVSSAEDTEPSEDTVTLSANQDVETSLNHLSETPLGIHTLQDFELNGNKRTTKVNDSLFVIFLESFTTYQNRMNDLLYDDPHYEIYNTLAYSPDGGVADEAFEFQDSIKKFGFMVASTEGFIYLEKDPDFLTRFSPWLSDRMNSFIVEYNKEIIHPLMEDYSIIISTDEHARRMIFWENFSKQHPDFELPDYANTEFKRLLFYLMMGTGNTPIHELGDQLKVRSDVLQVYKHVIDKYPHSIASEYLADYLSFMKQRNYIWDPSYAEYVEEKFPDSFSQWY